MVTITWKLYGADANSECDTVNLYSYYSSGTFIASIATSQDVSDESYTWTNPGNCGSNIKVRVQCSTAVAFSDYSGSFGIDLAPTAAPTALPSASPSLSPSSVPTLQPTSAPSLGPTLEPTRSPSLGPSSLPTLLPTLAPSLSPTMEPTPDPPTAVPSLEPSSAPTLVPSLEPTAPPTLEPTLVPSLVPSLPPSGAPSLAPSAAPTTLPSLEPSSYTKDPSLVPTLNPTAMPSLAPTIAPSPAPTIFPTALPTARPSLAPTRLPTPAPTPIPTYDDWCLEDVMAEPECTYHDQPLDGNYSEGVHFWAAKRNLRRSEWLRLACFGFDETSGRLLLRECQRYMSSEAFGRVHRSSTCPPVDDACSATDDGQWFCSQAVPGGIYRCPDRAASMVFCPKRSPCVQPEEGFSTGDVEAVKHAFCTSSKDFDPR
jgi:hypothetical protein